MSKIKSFLMNHGASFQDEFLMCFESQNTEMQASHVDTMTALTHKGILQIDGEDAINFIQGQLTNDIKQLNGVNSQYTGYCNPKGRLIALFLAFSHQNHIHLVLPLRQVDSILKRLKMFVMRSKVNILDQSEHIQCIGITGLNAPEKLKRLFKQVPSHEYELITLDTGTILRLPGDLPRYLIFTNNQQFESIWELLSTDFNKAGHSVWDYLEIQAGIPEVVIETQEAFVPQMINLDVLNAINFKKGCYTGQEIVARTHYLGTVKRRMFLANIRSENQPKPGDLLTDIDGETSVGLLVRSAPTPDGGFDVLAELRLDVLSQDKNNALWKNFPLNFKELPYSLS
jgi:folate-binding protein YgfZ